MAPPCASFLNLGSLLTLHLRLYVAQSTSYTLRLCSFSFQSVRFFVFLCSRLCFTSSLMNTLPNMAILLYGTISPTFPPLHCLEHSQDGSFRLLKQNFDVLGASKGAPCSSWANRNAPSLIVLPASLLPFCLGSCILFPAEYTRRLPVGTFYVVLPIGNADPLTMRAFVLVALSGLSDELGDGALHVTGTWPTSGHEGNHPHTPLSTTFTTLLTRPLTTPLSYRTYR